MSTTSPQQREAGENAKWQAQLAQQLSGVAMPELQGILGAGGMIPTMLAGRDTAGRLGMDAEALRSSTDQLNRGYGQAGFGNQQFIGYNALRSGESRYGAGPANAMMQGAATSLERDRQAALANLNFMSAQSSLSDYNKLLGLMGQGTQATMGLAGGFSGASNAALGGLSNQSQMGGILGGASSGASLGSIAGPWGMLAGGVIGGIAGGLSNP
jgi:hypothetical protein